VRIYLLHVVYMFACVRKEPQIFLAPGQGASHIISYTSKPSTGEFRTVTGICYSSRRQRTVLFTKTDGYYLGNPVRFMVTDGTVYDSGWILFRDPDTVH
jgi:hypothetical protein